MNSRPTLSGQTVVVIEGAKLILTARDPDRLQRAGVELAASTATFDATDFERLRTFFDELPGPIDQLSWSSN
jgi:NADP-dependent 3-hydroxy acid dehydrogenase YdfG